MRRVVLTLFCVLAISVTGFAHFVFIVPETGGLTARVLLSETLQPDAQVDVSLIAGAQLSLRDAGGRETALSLAKGEHAFMVALPCFSCRPPCRSFGFRQATGPCCSIEKEPTESVMGLSQPQTQSLQCIGHRRVRT
jgi:hypothetical protein